MNEQRMAKRPRDLKEIYYPAGMSNFGHTIDDRFGPKLRNGAFFGRHAGWNFNGEVWFADGEFQEDVYVFGAYMQTVFAPTLEELMRRVNDKFGWN